MGGHELLTTSEVAAYLRLKERKIYDLVAEGQIPHLRVTGKLLFPRGRIEAWLARHGGETPLPNLIAGSHDPLFDWALREAKTGLATFFDGSLDGLQRLSTGGAAAAGVHLPDPNVGDALARAGLHGRGVVVVEWARRTQGLILPPGNPKRIGGLGDLKGRRLVPRQPGAGARLLLDRLLAQAEIDPVLLDPPARSEADVAGAVLNGDADAGLGLLAVARPLGLDFVPLKEERFDLVVLRHAYFEPPLQRLVAFCHERRFRRQAARLGGYDLSGLGTVHHNAP